MSISNLNTIHLTDEQSKSILDALTTLENALNILSVNLSPEERMKYGSVNEQNKLFINKIYDFATNQPQLRSPDVDWEEFARDLKTRTLCESVLSRLEAMVLNVRNRKILGDFDNHQDALIDYAYTSYKASTKATGYEEKQNACKRFFARAKRNNAPSEVEKSAQ